MTGPGWWFFRRLCTNLLARSYKSRDRGSGCCTGIHVHSIPHSACPHQLRSVGEHGLIGDLQEMPAGASSPLLSHRRHFPSPVPRLWARRRGPPTVLVPTSFFFSIIHLKTRKIYWTHVLVGPNCDTFRVQTYVQRVFTEGMSIPKDQQLLARPTTSALSCLIW